MLAEVSVHKCRGDMLAEVSVHKCRVDILSQVSVYVTGNLCNTEPYISVILGISRNG